MRTGWFAVLVLLSACGGPPPRARQPPAVQPPPQAATEAEVEEAPQDALCEGGPRAGEYYFGGEAKLILPPAEERGPELPDTPEGWVWAGDLARLPRLHLRGRTEELLPVEHPARDLGMNGHVVDVDWEGALIAAVVTLDAPSLCLRRQVEIVDGDLTYRMRSGAVVDVSATNDTYARIAPTRFSWYGIVVPREALSTEGCTFEPTEPRREVVVEPGGEEACLWPAPNWSGAPERSHGLMRGLALEVLERRGGWMRVRTRRGAVEIEGWRRAISTPGEPYDHGHRVRVTAPFELSNGLTAHPGWQGHLSERGLTVYVPFAGGELWVNADDVEPSSFERLAPVGPAPWPWFPATPFPGACQQSPGGAGRPPPPPPTFRRGACRAAGAR